jgi:DNA-binding response OmpR family regulator
VKILLVEDDKKIVNFLRKGLRSEGETVDQAQDGEEGLHLAQEGHYDLIILDLMLPVIDGISLCQKLRAAGNHTPIIMLTARDSVDDRVKGLNAGADDYLTKPFAFSELLARLRALTRRHSSSHQLQIKVVDLTLDPESHEVKRAGKNISLSPTEFRLLQYLMRNEGKVLSKTMLLENVWGYDFDPESNIVDVYIKYLRDKIDKGFKKSLIQTVHGFGYKLCD